MKLIFNMLLGAAAAMLLAACGSIESDSYMISGAQHSLSLTRTKTFLWSDEWELALVTARSPECMRKHQLQPAAVNDFKLELYRSLEGNYIIRQGNNWYVTETRECRLQKFPAPPREPGDLLGVFAEKDGEMKFSAAPAGNSPAPTATPRAPATPPLPPPEAPPAAAPAIR